MYAKIYEKIFDSSVAGDWEVRCVFQDMLVLSDSEGVLDMTLAAFSRRTGVPLEVVTRAIKVLEAPDPESRTADFEGRRIVRLDDHRPWGWVIVNKEKYRDLKDRDAVRAQNRERKRIQREREALRTSEENSPPTAIEPGRPKPPEETPSLVPSRPSRVVTASHARSRHKDRDGNVDGNEDRDRPSGGRARSRKGLQIPTRETFPLDDRLRTEAQGLLPAGADVEWEHAAFLDFCTANGKGYADAAAGFKGWCRKTKQFTRGKSGHGPLPVSRHEPSEQKTPEDEKNARRALYEGAQPIVSRWLEVNGEPVTAPQRAAFYGHTRLRWEAWQQFREEFGLDGLRTAWQEETMVFAHEGVQA